MSAAASGWNCPLRPRSAEITSARLVVASAGWANGTTAIGRAAVSPPDTVISRPAYAEAHAHSSSAKTLFMIRLLWNKPDVQVTVEDRGIGWLGQWRGPEHGIF